MPHRHILALMALFIAVSFGTGANAQMRVESRDLLSPAERERHRDQMGGTISSEERTRARTEHSDMVRDRAGTRGTDMSEMGRSMKDTHNQGHGRGHDGAQGDGGNHGKGIGGSGSGHQYGGGKGSHGGGKGKSRGKGKGK